jgi:membrane-associated phospholipid phosphatase
LGLGAAAWVSKSFVNDEQIVGTLDGSPLDGVLDLGDRYGDGLTLAIGTAGLLLAGRASGDGWLSAAGGDLAHSLLWSGGIVWALKLGVDARRPNGGRYSFPSGHTAGAFAVAPVVAKHWGWKAGIPAYVLAVSTGFARMEERRHYSADVLFGAAIGLVVGYAVAGGDELPGLLEHISASPEGLGVSLRF